MNDKLVLVTGGAGFIGSNIVAGLVDRGRRVAICDRLGTDDKWRNLAKRELADFVLPELLGDWLDVEGDRVEAVVHMGAISSTTERDADLVVDSNFSLSLMLWQWCAEAEAPLIYASSAATYGDGSRGFDDDGSIEGLATLRPMNVYGWSKHLFDRRVARIVADGGPTPPRWAGLKFFNVYGPNEGHKGAMQSVVAKAHRAIRDGGPVELFTSHHPDYPDGGQRRDFVHVGDCVDIVLWLLDNPAASGLFNVGTGRARSFHDLANAVYAALGLPADIRFIPMPEEIRPKYQYFTEARMERLRKAGYNAPFTSLEDGVADYVRRYLEADDPYR
ncbi:ADP-glyceromanno-heptose 6-epimerase [Oceanibacterium hippocampi]|uniref:ADP-L-glycero-D-manno-heptose-6-epimerase n=1 Tax=Oceanibacterium hippocampi TaxID=745714 RepID=A0A1Y5RMQ9_9PROT|nr:ADP-glyceromanno-heptose 6-epimerase [Oceanibacterium hippocampi]SLN21134.1 ADP-L-glycero-D-manno-heptose-6-epimerase [Oceanibacterium hippocampi]